MKNNHLARVFIRVFILGIILSVVSCIPQKKLRYLQEVENQDTTIVKAANSKASYKIGINDELYIDVSSLNPKTYAFFNGGGVNTNKYTINNDVSLYLTSYTVDDSGYVELPVVGKIKIDGMTVDEAALKIENSLKKFLTEVSVTVKLSGFRITILGEVKRPGKYIDYVSQMNVFEALALAGDMTPYGNREKVFLIREENGKEQVYFLNVLDREVLKDPNFNLLPNDIIYVESLNAKTWGFESFPYALILSSLTTFIALTTLILQLNR